MALDRWWSIIRLRLRSLFRGAAVEADLADELRDHLARETAAGVARGLTAEAARTAALRRVGGVDVVKDACRDERRVGVIDELARDLRHAMRVLRASPGFTSAAVLSLALGVGANTAIFQLISAVRLRPLPVARPGELVIVDIASRTWQSGNYDGRYPDLTNPLWEQLRAHADPFTAVLAWGQTTFDLAPRGLQRFAENSLWVSGDFFNVLGVTPAIGRLFTANDDVRGCGAPGVVLSHAFWHREYGASSAVVGRSINVNGRPLNVLGVSEAGFFGVEVGRAFDLAVPICAEALLRGAENSRRDLRDFWWLSAMGRLKPGWSAERATAYLHSISPLAFRQTLPERVSAENADKYRAFTFQARPASGGFSGLRDQYDLPLKLLLAVAGMVLLIACANIANLLLSRGSVRVREMALRLALGASRGRLIRQLLVESLLLAAIGAGLGASLAPVLGRAVVALLSSDVSPMFVDLAPDWRLLAFTIGLTAGTCVIFGLAPALRVTNVPPGAAMTVSSRTHTPDRGQSRMRRALVAIQVALSLALVVGGLLFGRSLFNLLTVDAGFHQAGVLQLDLSVAALALDPDARRAFYRDLDARLRAIPGVAAVATTGTIPTGGTWYERVFLAGSPAPRKEWSVANQVSAGYFDTLRIPILAGRDFDDDDRPGSSGVVIVNEAFARQFLTGTGGRADLAVGATFQLEGAPSQPGRTVRIAGLVGNTKYENLREAFRPIVYLPSSQSQRVGTSSQFLLRSSASLTEMTAAVTHAVGDLNPDISFHFHDFQGQIRSSLRRDALMATLCGFFALVGATLAAIGVYSVNAYAVAQRTVEIGIRLALGADRRAIVRLMLGEAMWVVSAGLAAGAAMAWVAARGVQGLLFGVPPADPLTVGVAVVLLAAVATCASYLPARRASRANAVQSLRSS